MDEPQELSKSIILLLPSYLDGFIWLFNWMGFSVIHSYYPEGLEMEIKEFGVDLALERQELRELGYCGLERPVSAILSRIGLMHLPPAKNVSSICGLNVKHGWLQLKM